MVLRVRQGAGLDPRTHCPREALHFAGGLADQGLVSRCADLRWPHGLKAKGPWEDVEGTSFRSSARAPEPSPASPRESARLREMAPSALSKLPRGSVVVCAVCVQYCGYPVPTSVAGVYIQAHAFGSVCSICMVSCPALAGTAGPGAEGDFPTQEASLPHLPPPVHPHKGCVTYPRSAGADSMSFCKKFI